jgi:hypothetical protein
MKPLHYPDHSQVPPVPEQTALKKRLDTRKSEILENLLMSFLFYLNEKKLINNHDFDYEKEARKFLKKVGQK